MRLIRLTLEHWRGVARRELGFSSGVTLVEGPNEVGKSTLVEAIRVLFKEMDSSKKMEVKAIQPVGQDVGSRVEAEIETGRYHFVYAKTYNKSRQTTLRQLAPEKLQLTGREAHERVTQILAETVDMALWEALLVDQGEKVSPANLANSSSLSSALDEAVGTDLSRQEHGHLYELVREAYEQYFTLKTGRSKFAGERDALDEAHEELEAARQALEQIEQHVDQHLRVETELVRAREELPKLLAKAQDYERKWDAIRALELGVEATQSELSAADVVLHTVKDAYDARKRLAEQVESTRAELAAVGARPQLLRDKVSLLSQQATALRRKDEEHRHRQKVAQQVFLQAQDDERFARDVEAMRALVVRLEQLERVAARIREHTATLASVTMDRPALDEYRAADRQVDLLCSKRDAAATIVSVTAERSVDVVMDDERSRLAPAEVLEKAVAQGLRVHFPGVATVRVEPSHSVATLQQEVDEARNDLRRLEQVHGVGSLREAVVAHDRRQLAEDELEQLKIREAEISQGAVRADLEQRLASLQTRCDAYSKRFASARPLPESVGLATQALTKARAQWAELETQGGVSNERVTKLTDDLSAVQAELRLVEQEVVALEATAMERQSQLESKCATESDEELQLRYKNAHDSSLKLHSELKEKKSQLIASTPESIEVLFTNASDVLERARSDANGRELELAVLTDRLVQAQADGRFEAMELCERKQATARTVYESTNRRAQAAQLLWVTLNTKRDAARRAYVQPLKEAIERLGSIVFGSGFEVSIAEDWSIVSRTLRGKTLPFDALSVGAREQLGILTRLAAAQIVSKHGGVPLIIDDALGFSDPSRLETMGAAIAAAGRHCQIIILTCTPGRFTHVGRADVMRLEPVA